jgi:hypothetical protein
MLVKRGWRGYWFSTQNQPFPPPKYFVCTLTVGFGIRSPLWSSGQSSWLRIRRSGFDFRRYQIFWVVVLERGPLSLVSTTEELFERKNSGFGLEIWEYGRRVSSRWPRGTLYPQKLALTSKTSGGWYSGLRPRILLFFYWDIQRNGITFNLLCFPASIVHRHTSLCSYDSR